jgi:hypothetical protein
MTVVQPGIVLASLAGTTTTLSPDNPFYAYVGVPVGQSVNAQNVRAGAAPITVTFAVVPPGVGVLETSTVQDDTVTAVIPPRLYYTPGSVAAGGVAFDPVGVGTATVTARAPGFVAQTLATQTVTVNAPGISVGAQTVGAGLQTTTSFNLGASNHGPITVTVTSSNPSILRLATNDSTPGVASLAIPVADLVTSVGFYVQGVEGVTGSVTLTVTAPGFLDGTAVLTVVQPGIILSGAQSTLAAGAANDLFYAYVGVPVGSSVNVQNVRAGSPGITVTASSSNVSAAQIVTSTGAGASRTAVILSRLYYTPNTLATGGLEIDPLAPGQTSLNVTAPGFLAQPLATQTITITP